MPDAILTLNAGSSSLKSSLFEIDGAGLRLSFRGEIEGIGGHARFSAHDASGRSLDGPDVGDDPLAGMLTFADRHLGGDALRAVGHRVVHGGDDHLGPKRVDDALLASLTRLVPFAPLHQTHNLDAIRAVSRLRPGLAQVACFDTAFHQTMSATARRLPLPPELGLRRYGFHGLSYEHIAQHLRETAPALAAGRVVVAHLGSGDSLCALRDGRSVETTMSLTALDGLMMGTRTGAIDPGALLYLLQARGMDATELEDLLYHRAGLLGVSGVSADMRALAASTDPRARAAVDLYLHRLVREIGGMVAVLGGLDALVFTGGIGEHAALIRINACRALAWLDLTIDADANAAHAERIDTADSRVAVFVVPANEELVIARHTRAVIGELA